MKIVVITGVSRGIGLATAKKFLDEGWTVIGTYLNTKIPLTHKNLIAIKYDQGDHRSVATAAEAIQEHGQVDVLVNNAGINIDGVDSKVDVDKVRKTLDVNLLGVIDLTERLVPLIPKGGHVINVDSLYGSFSYPIDDETSTAYRISKAGLNMYTRTLAYKLESKGIIVSSLDPGWVKTDMGNMVATSTEKPDRKPSDAAEDIYRIVTKVKKSGYFWKLGKVRQW